MNVERDVVQHLIQLLEEVRRRPWVYIGTDPEHILPFITGASLILKSMGINYGDIFPKIVEQRGWKYTNFHPSYQFREKIPDDEGFVRECIDIELDCWRLFLDTQKGAVQ